MSKIKSSTDLRNNYDAISAFCHESCEPIFIMKDGQSDLALMSIEVYEGITRNQNVGLEDSKEELYQLLSAGRADVSTGRTRLHREVMADIRRRVVDDAL